MINQFKTKNCPYCGSPGNFHFRISSRIYKRCSECDLIYKEEQDSYDNIITRYREKYFNNYSADQLEGGRNKLFSNILDLLETRKSVGKLLDIGTGCGFFLIAAKRALFLIAQAVQTISCGKILLGTSLEVMAVKKRQLIANNS